MKETMRIILKLKKQVKISEVNGRSHSKKIGNRWAHKAENPFLSKELENPKFEDAVEFVSS